MSLLLDALNKGRSDEASGAAAPDARPHGASLNAELEWSLEPEPPPPAAPNPAPQAPGAGDPFAAAAAPSPAPAPHDEPPASVVQAPPLMPETAQGAQANERHARRWWQRQLASRPQLRRSRRVVGVAVLTGALAIVAASVWWMAQQGWAVDALASLIRVQASPVAAIPQANEPETAPTHPLSQEDQPAGEGDVRPSSPQGQPVSDTLPAPATPATSPTAVAQAEPRRAAAPKPRPQVLDAARPAAAGAQPPIPPSSATAPQLRVERDPLDVLREQADAALLASRWDEAQRIYEAWLQRQPDDPAALAGLALALHRQQRWMEAWQMYQRALQRWPENAALRSAALVVLSRLDPTVAESRLRDWLADQPGDALAQAALGTLLARQERWALALEPLQQAVRLVPTDAVYHYNLAVVLERLNRLDLALLHYRQSLALGDPSLPQSDVQRRIQLLQHRLARAREGADTPSTP